MLTIWVPKSEQLCCGKPFAIGSQVTWTLDRPFDLTDIFLPEDAVRIDGCEVHHGPLVPDDAFLVTGTVESVRTVHVSYGPRPDIGLDVVGPLPASAWLTVVEGSAAPGTAWRDFLGFLVEVRTSL